LKTVEKVEIEVFDRPVKVYNFEVEDWHTYYVTEQGVLVHNAKNYDGNGNTGVGNTQGSSKRITNRNGRKGGEAHQSVVNNIKASNASGKIVREHYFRTPGGTKNYRFADAVEMVNGNIKRIYQVGKVNKNGLPVLRESLAIYDIMNSPKYNGAPIYFLPYNANIGPIIYTY